MFCWVMEKVVWLINWCRVLGVIFSIELLLFLFWLGNLEVGRVVREKWFWLECISIFLLFILKWIFVFVGRFFVMFISLWVGIVVLLVWCLFFSGNCVISFSFRLVLVRESWLFFIFMSILDKIGSVWCFLIIVVICCSGLSSCLWLMENFMLFFCFSWFVRMLGFLGGFDNFFLFLDWICVVLIFCGRYVVLWCDFGYWSFCWFWVGYDWLVFWIMLLLFGVVWLLSGFVVVNVGLVFWFCSILLLCVECCWYWFGGFVR